MLFLVWELGDQHPVVDLSLFARRNFAIGTATISLAYGAYFGAIVLLPLWLQQFMGYTATDAGWVLAPVGLLAILLTPLVGKNLQKVDPRVFATGSFAIFALVLFMRSHFNTNADLQTLLIPTIIQGAAAAIFFVPLVTLSLSGLEAERVPGASGLFNFARITAGSLVTSIATTWWARRASLHHAQLAERLTPYDPSTAQALANMQANGLTAEQSREALNRLVDQQAFMLSANDIFLVSAVFFLLLIAVVCLARPVKGGGHAPVAAE